MWSLAGKSIHSRMLLGTAQYPSLETMQLAIQAAKTNVVTVSLKRENPQARGGKSFWKAIQSLGCAVLPNTAGCKNMAEAVTIAQIAQEMFETNWIKLEIIQESDLLQPHSLELIKAAEKLCAMGFEVFPFCTEDLSICRALVDAGCQILMPWGAPIGSGKGLLNPDALRALRMRFPQITLIIDAGLGSPAHALQAMLLGYDGILVNSAIAKAIDPVTMAKAFGLAVKSGRLAYHAGVIPEIDMAVPSTCLSETFFWREGSTDEFKI